MDKKIAIFNNKGGVGKTTYLFHIAHRLANNGRKVMMVDGDSQCNLTSYSMRDSAISRSWGEAGNSIFRNIEPVYRTTGDIRKRTPTRIESASGELFIVPGDLNLSNFEDLLGDTWSAARGGAEPAIRAQSALHRYIDWAANEISADIVLVDLGPNLGALNRSLLASCNYFTTPVSPDLFSIQGTANLGRKLVTWRREWDQCNNAWEGDIEIPAGRPEYLGYVVQQHNVRENPSGMTKGWKIYGDRLEPAIINNIVIPLSELDQVSYWDNESYLLGRIPNLHSLVPYSQAAKKPIFMCDSSDGLVGEHINKARNSADKFDDIVETFEHVIEE